MHRISRLLLPQLAPFLGWYFAHFNSLFRVDFLRLPVLG